MKKAVIYARLSTQPQSDQLELQIAECQEAAVRLGVDSAQVFSDIAPAIGEERRRGLEQALRFCRPENGITHFICKNAGRLSRSEDELRSVQSRLADLGVELVFVSGPNVRISEG